MIQTKIFSVLEIAKKTDSLTQGYKERAIQNILQEIAKDATNINDAFVILDFIKDVTTQVSAAIHDKTVEHIVKNGDNEALGVQLVVERTKVFNYAEDKEWLETTKKIGIFTDAAKKREKFIQDSAKTALDDNKPPGITFATKQTIVTRALN